MEILFLTLFLSMLLAVAFIYLFATQHRNPPKSMEQQALLPLRDDAKHEKKTD